MTNDPSISRDRIIWDAEQPVKMAVRAAALARRLKVSRFLNALIRKHLPDEVAAAEQAIAQAAKRQSARA